MDAGLGLTQSMSSIPLHEIDEKIKVIENEYNNIITKEMNMR